MTFPSAPEDAIRQKAPDDASMPVVDGFPVPLNEQARLQSLESLRILDTPADDRFDRISRLAAAHFRTPIARITFVDSDRNWFKSSIGIKVREVPRRIAICSHAIMSDEVLVSRDLKLDPRFRSGPQVAGAPHLRFYAGAPIVLDDGMRVGSVCVADTDPHPDFSDEDADFLADLARIVVHELELHRQLASRNEQLEAAERRGELARNAKKRFLDIVTHELKTPLSHIVGFGKILAEQKLGALGNENYADYARFLYESAEHLDGLIGRVLAYSSAEAGELRLAETVSSVETSMNRCLELTSMRSRDAGVTVVLEIDPAAPRTLHADHVQLAEAMVQLLDNAIAFSPHGAHIDLRIDRTENDDIRIRVIDEGPGIDCRRLEPILAAFRQGDDGLNRKHEGIGLGLPIARAVTELHGGVLALANHAGGGTVAQITLPAYRGRDAQPLPAMASF